MVKQKNFISNRDLLIEAEYLDCVRELMHHERVRSMSNYIQHNNIDCLEHCLFVSYYSYLLCRYFGLDWRAAARGGLLHDFFLYDWHKKDKKNRRGLHGFSHPRTALRNAKRYFELNALEEDIISKHMWPLTLHLPRYKESYIVVMIDKYCALIEILSFRRHSNIKKLRKLLLYQKSSK